MSEAHHHPKPSEDLPLRESERRRLLWVLVLTGVTMAAEIAGGILTHSLALLGDAFHMLTHFLAVSLTYGAIAISLRPAPPDKTYRWWRLEILAGFINGIALLPIAGYVLYEAIERWTHPVEIKLAGMMVLGVVGLAENLVAAAILHRHSKHDVNMRGAFIHMLADSFSSVGVLAAGAVITFTGWKQADPFIAAVISVLILGWCVSLLRSSAQILLESVPAHLDIGEIRAAMAGVEGVGDVHDLHVWTITCSMYALTAHVRLREDARVSESEEVGRRLRSLLDERFDINHATLQFETCEERDACCEHDRVRQDAGGSGPPP